MIWVVLYIVGGFAFWVSAFRIFASDPIMGVQAADSKHEAIGAILFSGFVSLVMAAFWPAVGAIFLVWKYAVAPVIKKREVER